MLPDEGTRKDELRDTFRYIEGEALPRATRVGCVRYRLYTYGELSALSSIPEEAWRHDGWVRRMLYGLSGRAWLLTEFRLWFKADETHHTGLLFTADPKLGMYWLYDQKTDEAFRNAQCLLHFASEGERLQPMHRDYFRTIARGGQRMLSAADKLNELRDPRMLRLLGIEDNGKRDDEVA